MIGTTFPAFLVAFIIFCAMSLTGNAGTYDPELVDGLSTAIEENFAYMSPVLMLPVLVIIVVAVVQMPAIPGVLLAALTGCIFAVIFQGANFAECVSMVHYLSLIHIFGKEEVRQFKSAQQLQIFYFNLFLN